jgi:aspartyl-tRNA(Asn)/glutamyl-tRNA(Gln) amidotransferase subunit C
MAQVTKEDVLRVARLARLTLDEQDAEAMTAHFTKVLAYIEKLTVLPTDDIEPATHAVTVAAPLRADCVTNAPDPALLQTAPAKDDTFFKVPKIIE